MKITILGSGAWEGIPAPFCACRVCTIAKNDPSSPNNRTRPQLLVENGAQHFLIEISPDIRLQAARAGLEPVKDFVISHAHYDHMDGIKELHQYSVEVTKGINIYCSSATKTALIADEYSYIPQRIRELKPLQAFEIGGVTMTPLPVYHMNKQDNLVAEDQLANTFGFLLEHGDKRVAYMADYYRVSRAVMDKIKQADAIICDGTYLLTDTFKDYKINHLHGQEIIDFAESTQAKDVYYHSVSHLTGKTHDEIQALLPLRHTLTYDGFSVPLE